MALATSRDDALAGDVAKAALGVGGLAMCITLAFLGMRAVMDVGGACAEGGPYVPRVECPGGATPALLLGIFGLFLFGGIAAVYGSRLGGIWAATPLFAWSGLFLALGWNFLAYGVFDPPGDEGVIWGWLICGVLFVAMGIAPLLAGATVFGDTPIGRGRAARRGGSPGASVGAATVALRPAADADPAAVDTFNRALAAAGVPVAVEPPGSRDAALRGIAADMGAVLVEAADEIPADPLARAAAAPAGAATRPAEGTPALLDRLERLAALRDRGLLDADEFETAKASVMRELEDRA